MDKHKSSNYNEGRPRLAVPQRSSTVPPQQGLPSKRATSQGSKPSTANSHRHAHQTPIATLVHSLLGGTIILRIRAFFRGKKTAVIISGVVLLVGIFTAELIRQHNITKTYGTTNPNKIIENLEYQTVLPTGKSITELGGWRRVSPPTGDPVYAYNDTIDGISISVSQQPLPQSFSNDSVGQLAELAKQFNATTKLDRGNTTIYVGTSAKGPQSALMVKNGLLILIKSQEKVSDNAWAKYAQALN